MSQDEAQSGQERMIEQFASLVRDGVRDGLVLYDVKNHVEQVFLGDFRRSITFSCRVVWEEPRPPQQEDPDSPQVVYPSPD